MVCKVMNQSDNGKLQPSRPGGFVEPAISCPKLVLRLQTNLTVEVRCQSGDQPNPGLINTAGSQEVVCPVGRGSYLHHECEFEGTVDGFGPTAITVAAIALVQQLCNSGALKLLRRSSRAGPKWSFDELLFPQLASA